MAIAIKMDRVPIEHETVLWENPNPTASFGNQNVPVTQSILNFNKIRIYWYINTANADIENPDDYLEIKLDGNSSVKLDTGTRIRAVLGSCVESTNYYRFVNLVADSITFGTAKTYNSTTTSNTTCIPYKVTGISRREITIPSKGNEKIDVLWVNPTPDSAMAANTDVTLAHGAEKYDILRVYHKPNASDTISEADRWVDFYIGKEPEKFTPDSYNSRLTFGDLVGTTTYTRGFWFPERIISTIWDDTTDLYTTIRFGNGCRVANTTTNTSNAIPLIICGVNYELGTNERVSNSFVVNSNNWSNTTVVFGDENCYYNDIPIQFEDGVAPVISIYAETLGNTISEDQRIAYDLWKYATVDPDNLILRLYSTKVPETSFEILVEGVL